MLIHPVILPVHENRAAVSIPAKISAARRMSRVALALSATYHGVRLGPLIKDEHGAPVKNNGLFWSLSHKPGFVAATTAAVPIGIDIEKIESCSPGLYASIARPEEWALAPRKDERLFFRYWTAKEAVLKAAGVGLYGLSECRIRQIKNENQLTVDYAGEEFTVLQHRIAADHLVAVAMAADAGLLINWQLPPFEGSQ